MEKFSEVYSISGNDDLVAIARVADNKALLQRVTARMVQIAPIQHTETVLASLVLWHDIEALFAIGA